MTIASGPLRGKMKLVTLRGLGMNTVTCDLYFPEGGAFGPLRVWVTGSRC